MGLKDLIVAHLDHARRRTLALLDPLDDADLTRQVSPIMSPLVWDLAHIAHYEELWLVRALTGTGPTDARYDDLYDAFAHPRAERAALSILGPPDARAFAHDVRTRTLDVLDSSRLDSIRLDSIRLDSIRLDTVNPLLDRGFVYGMVVQHEHQHCETMLAAIQLGGWTYGPAARSGHSASPESPAPRPEELSLPGGRFVMGTAEEPWAYDNERPAHEVEVEPFRIDRTPVTNAQFAAFVAEGGYDDERHWDCAGWDWRAAAQLEHPQSWCREGNGDWSRLRFGHREALPPDEPVQHVCWYEADAFARWAGKRLPSETEWEFAAAWGPDARKRRYPWGDVDPTPAHANLGQIRFGPAPTHTVTAGSSAWGCLQMVGDVWEWTASDFEAYPGFRAFPYREYSEVFNGAGYKVLRGGSWAVPPVACRTTFRNWDLPIRRQIFAGFRCARDG